MFNNLKPHVLAIVVGFNLLIALTGCSSLSSVFSTTEDLEAPIQVPSKYVYFPNPSVDTLNKEQSALTNMLIALESPNTSSEDKSLMFYNIGSIYDDLGLESMARFMYMNSIVQNPTFYRPYQVLGPYFYRDGKLGDAVDFLDAAYELDTEKSDPYINLHRGIIMYYTNHDNYAYEDMKVFYEADKNDPYRLLCFYFAIQKRYGNDVAKMLLTDYYNSAKNSNTVSQNWGFNLIKLHLHKISVDELFEGILKIRYDDDLFQEHLCEAYFYVGKLMRDEGNDKLAYDYFKLCESTKKYGFLEYRLAQYEMADLENKYNIKKFVTPEDITQ